MYKGKTVNIIMPVYNEERTLEEVIRRVLKQKMVDRLIIVNDASKDNSLSIIKKMARKDRRITYFTNNPNRGKGYSVRRALAEVKKGIILVQDADKEYYPEDYPKLFAAMAPNTVVYGTRMGEKESGHRYLLAKGANIMITALFNGLYFQHLTDLNTCYKVFTKDMLDGITLKADRFMGEAEICIGRL